jgi:hypothetical protein
MQLGNWCIGPERYPELDRLSQATSAAHAGHRKPVIAMGSQHEGQELEMDLRGFFRACILGRLG